IGFDDTNPESFRKIPKELLKCNKTIIYELIAGIYDNIYQCVIRQHSIYFYSLSEEFINQLKYIFINMGLLFVKQTKQIPSKIHINKLVNEYSLRLNSYHEVSKFYNEIPLRNKERIERGHKLEIKDK